MTVEKAIVLIECSANELKETLAEITMPSSAAEQIQRYIDAYDMAISALRAQQKRENQKPLTLDELRKMEGEPVWIVEYPDWGHWELSADAEDYVTDREPGFYGMKHNDPAGRYGLHKLGWLAYRQKPEEDDHA